ncbi:AEC family transporter [Polaromonas jejuensis]|uniref:AEC family transporter n=1 Tax=Polaromonas jejuensis TaxID=457502 RepID=A0ABW0QGA9_9BURK|nr:AEC family transporter [Polaromonas jejuensis]
MLDILAITGPIYITIALGFLTTRLGLFARTDMRVFGKFVINLALPALLFNALAQRQIGEILNGRYLLAYLAGSLAALGLGFFWCRRQTGRSQITSTFYAMGMSCSNSGFVGYPILLLTMAPVAGVALALNMMVENLLMIPLLLAMAERGRGDAGRWYRVVGQSLARLASNPMIIGLLAGLVISLLEWKLPAPVLRTVNLFAMSSGALSLFVIGGTLVGLPMRGMGKETAPIAIGKLMLHPLAVQLALLALPWLGLPAMEPSLRTAAVLMAAMPMMGIYPILAQAYGQEDFSAAALLVTTVASFFTLSGLLWLLRHGLAWA